MEYSKMTKAELLNVLEERDKSIHKNQYLANAVQLRDKEIRDLKDGTVPKSLYENLHKTYEKERTNFQNALAEKTKELESLSKQPVDKDKQALMIAMNNYVNLTRSTLKSIQGVLELSIELESYLSYKKGG